MNNEYKGQDLYLRYPSQISPQDVMLCVDAEHGTLDLQTNPEIGNAVPMRVRHGHELRFTIPLLSSKGNEELLEQALPLAERIEKGYSSEWDGQNHVARYSADAARAIEELRALCEVAEDLEQREVYVADEWYSSVPDGELAAAHGINANTTDEELEAIAAKELESFAIAAPSEAVLDGLPKYLEAVRQAMRDDYEELRCELRLPHEQGMPDLHTAMSVDVDQSDEEAEYLAGKLGLPVLQLVSEWQFRGKRMVRIADRGVYRFNP